MSIFNELLPKLYEISNTYTQNFNDSLQIALECIDKFEEEFKNQNGRSKTREKQQQDKNSKPTLQSIDEGEDDQKKHNSEPTDNISVKSSSLGSQSSDTERPAPKKRSKHEVEGMSSPEQDKRQKRNASVKAQSIISKQVNVNLTQKLRRENSVKDTTVPRASSRTRKIKDEDKENVVPIIMPASQIKQEKVSLLAEPEAMDVESVALDVPIKQDVKDDIAMPPPVAPVPKPRKALLKEKPHDVEEPEEDTSRRSRRSTRNKKQDSTLPSVASSRSIRLNSRARAEEEPKTQIDVAPVAERPKRTRGRKKLSGPPADGDSNTQSSQESLPGDEAKPLTEAPPVEAIPKRTRARKKLSEAKTDSVNTTESLQESLPGDVRKASADAISLEARPKRTRGRKILSEAPPHCGNATQSLQEHLPASPAEKPRPKRTRRAQKADKEQTKPVEPEPIVSPKEERLSEEHISSPILPVKEMKITKNKNNKTHTTLELDKTKELNITNKSEKDVASTKTVDKDVASTKTVDKDVASTKTVDKDEARTKTVDKDLVKDKVNKTLTKSKSEKAIIGGVKVNGLVKSNTFESMTTARDVDQLDNVALDETRILSKATEMDQTMVLPNGVYNHAPVTPKNIHMNETVVLEETMVLGRPPMDATVVLEKTMVLDKPLMDATVVLEKCPAPTNLTDDNSLLTDDNDTQEDIPDTPPRKGIPDNQPASAVKEKVQQFEEMASRVTRTKTRAMAKKEELKDETEKQTSPDKVSKAMFSSETLTKMNSLIFNEKAHTFSSASKPRAIIPLPKLATSSASKAQSVNKWKEAAEESQNREDARRKKEAMLEAKRELQKRKREEKMAAAAAARSAAERERKALLEAAAKERMEKQAHADNEKVERLKEVERKKQELARKALETEERRKAEEGARQQRLAEEQRRAQQQRKKQIEEQEAMKREEAKMNKEIEKKHREYLEKQKKQKIDKVHTPFKTPGTPLSHYSHPLPPAYMEDGFQYLNSDEDADSPERPCPTWSESKVRRRRLAVQSLINRSLVDRLFSVRVHSPDLSEIFPTIERARLKRTSSAVWHTPPPLPPCRE